MGTELFLASDVRRLDVIDLFLEDIAVFKNATVKVHVSAQTLTKGKNFADVRFASTPFDYQRREIFASEAQSL